MNNIKYEEDSEDIDFPPIKFTHDIIYVDKNPKKDFCSKLKKFCNQKKILIFLSICILLFRSYLKIGKISYNRRIMNN